jgi:hypothetical protein
MIKSGLKHVKSQLSDFPLRLSAHFPLRLSALISRVIKPESKIKSIFFNIFNISNNCFHHSVFIFRIYVGYIHDKLIRIRP